MKVFISSLIAGFEPMRAAARAAIVTLRHEPIMAEDFGALPHSPQIACLNGLRSSDVVVLVLGDRYGAVQGGSGLSANGLLKHQRCNGFRDNRLPTGCDLVWHWGVLARLQSDVAVERWGETLSPVFYPGWRPPSPGQLGDPRGSAG